MVGLRFRNACTRCAMAGLERASRFSAAAAGRKYERVTAARCEPCRTHARRQGRERPDGVSCRADPGGRHALPWHRARRIPPGRHRARKHHPSSPEQDECGRQHDQHHGNGMKFVIFGLTITSSWGNGHATLWRGLCKALAKRGHQIVFFERDVSYYAGARDFYQSAGIEIVLYPEWEAVRAAASLHARDSDVAIVTSYCPDAIQATGLVLSEARGSRIFYDLDTPVTLAQVRRSQPVPYIGEDRLSGFDLVLSFTGGATLDELKTLLSTPRVDKLYGLVAL